MNKKLLSDSKFKLHEEEDNMTEGLKRESLKSYLHALEIRSTMPKICFPFVRGMQNIHECKF